MSRSMIALYISQLKWRVAHASQIAILQELFNVGSTYVTVNGISPIVTLVCKMQGQARSPLPCRLRFGFPEMLNGE